jgi:repressor LexA
MPSYQELARSLGYASSNSIQQYVKSLALKGYLTIEKNRGIKPMRESSEMVNVPLVGRVACGLPILAAENIEGFIPVEKSLVKNHPKKFFFLTAHGDSMNKAGIDDQDLLLIESQSTADPGQVVLALVGDEATIKILKPHKDYVALIPKSSNPVHKPMIFSEGFSIQGIVHKIIKKKDLSV